MAFLPNVAPDPRAVRFLPLSVYTAPGPGSVRRASGLSIMIGPVIPSEISGIKQKWNTKMLALISPLPSEPVAE